MSTDYIDRETVMNMWKIKHQRPVKHNDTTTTVWKWWWRRRRRATSERIWQCLLDVSNYPLCSDVLHNYGLMGLGSLFVLIQGLMWYWHCIWILEWIRGSGRDNSIVVLQQQGPLGFTKEEWAWNYNARILKRNILVVGVIEFLG